jgi:hypothetical protein
MCSEFDLTPRAEDFDDDDLDDDDVYPLLPSAMPTAEFLFNIPTPSGLPTAAPQQKADLVAFYDATTDVDPEHAFDSLVIDSTEDIIYSRYGLIVESREEPVDPAAWNRMRLVIGHMSDPFPAALQGSVMEVIGALCTNNDVGHPLCDLTNSDRLSTLLATAQVFIKPLSTTEGKSLYLIKGKYLHRSRDEEWAIVVPSAATALMCIRKRWGPHSIDIARSLVKRGIPFQTLLPLPDQWEHSIPRIRPYVGLGWRQSGYNADAFEYAAYEDRRDAFLRQPHGRAALLVGGIVWRLALDALGYQPALDGPSMDAPVYGCRHSSPVLGDTLSSEHGYDDSLSPDELDLVCGVYLVDTGLSIFYVNHFWSNFEIQVTTTSQLICLGGQSMTYGARVV